MILYSFNRKSMNAFKDSKENKYSIYEYELDVKDSIGEELLEAYPDRLSLTPWENKNNQWVKTKASKPKEDKEDKNETFELGTGG